VLFKEKVGQIVQFRAISVIVGFGMLVSGGCNDGGGDENVAEVVENIPPVAFVTVDKGLVLENDSAGFSSRYSSDSDGDIVSYSWRQVEGRAVAFDNKKSRLVFVAPEVSEDEILTFELTVTDDGGAIGTDKASLTVKNTPEITYLNDTGQIIGGNFPSSNNSACIGETIAEQDCSHGRDVANNDNSDGHAGFSFTKLDIDGNELEASASEWRCVQDNVTGLIWEVKIEDGGIHDKNTSYRWGGIGALNDGGEYYGDWDALVDGSNLEALCGYSNWRVPTIYELESLVNYDRTGPAIDINYFPNTMLSGYFSINNTRRDTNTAWYVNFDTGSSRRDGLRDNSKHLKYVRLVHNAE